MPELLVGATLPHLGKTETLQNRNHLPRFEEQALLPLSGQRHALRSDELSFERWLTVLQQHFNHFVKVSIELIERVALRVSSRKSWDIPDVKSRFRISFDDCCVFLHEGNEQDWPRSRISASLSAQ